MKIKGSILWEKVNIVFIYIKHITEKTDSNMGDEGEDT